MSHFVNKEIEIEKERERILTFLKQNVTTYLEYLIKENWWVCFKDTQFIRKYSPGMWEISEWNKKPFRDPSTKFRNITSETYKKQKFLVSYRKKGAYWNYMLS